MTRRTEGLHAGAYFPTNYAASTVAPSFTTLDSSQKDTTLTLSGGNLAVASTGSPGGVLSVAGHITGKYFLEFSTAGQTGGYQAGAGIINAHAPKYVATGNGIGNDGFSAGKWNNDSNVYVINNTVAGDANFFSANGDVTGMAVDLTNTRIWYRKNGSLWNGNSSADPATNVGGFDISACANGSTIYVYAVCVDANPTITFNFGATAYGTAAPSGFGNW